MIEPGDTVEVNDTGNAGRVVRFIDFPTGRKCYIRFDSGLYRHMPLEYISLIAKGEKKPPRNQMELEL